MAEQEGNSAEKARHGFALTLTRSPSESETATLVRLHEQLKIHYSENLDEAVQMASDPIGPIPEGGDVSEYAAWTVVANALLNLDELFLKR